MCENNLTLFSKYIFCTKCSETALKPTVKTHYQ